MTKLLLSIHVLAAILAIGPVAVAASLFPRYARESPGTAAFLYRVCRGYTVVGVAVPAFGAATGARMGVLGDAWLVTSIALTTVAAILLVGAILPGQQRLLAATGTGADTGMDTGANTGVTRATAARLSMVTGVFNLLWATVTVLMIVRPGSTTGA
ncbi:membrane protein [Actinomadura kijaniata]|uniref:Integral membrane protein n=1 Tax=Actinomadura namibiensis TaxID=182080 RepID=A0A7W3LQ70_ACTNM|nr:hypothetical protein [Actinomadura namibiensis]MBA8952280.1 hypothetical protein [Actinomadura namibiensis]